MRGSYHLLPSQPANSRLKPVFSVSLLLIRESSQLDCIVSAVLNSTCSASDTPCICANAALQAQAQQCVLASCTVREQLSTLTFLPLLPFTVTPSWISSDTLTLVATRNITNAQCGIFSGHDHSWVPPMVFFIVFAGIIFVLRLVSRIVCHTDFWWDDFFNLLAAVTSLPAPARLPSWAQTH